MGNGLCKQVTQYYLLAEQLAFIFGLNEGLDFEGVLLVELTVERGAHHVSATRLEQVALAWTTFSGWIKSDPKHRLSYFLRSHLYIFLAQKFINFLGYFKDVLLETTLATVGQLCDKIELLFSPISGHTVIDLV